MPENPNRRQLLKNVLGGTAAVAASSFLPNTLLANTKEYSMDSLSLKGKINHSACRWCYSKYPIDELARNFKSLGMVGMDLVGPKEWNVLKENGLIVESEDDINETMVIKVGKHLFEGKISKVKKIK